MFLYWPMKVLFSLLLLLSAVQLRSQENYTLSDYQRKPLWITMMNEEHPNYFEIQKAFETYWQYHKMPEGEGDMDVQQKEKNKKRFSKREQQEAREEARLRMAIKKYHWWMAKMEPYVQEDGSIKRNTK